MPVVIDPMHEQEMKETNLNIKYPPNNVVKLLQKGHDPYWERKKGIGSYRIAWNKKAKAVIANEYPPVLSFFSTPKVRYTWNATQEKWLTPVKENKNKKTIHPGRPGSMEVANLKLWYPSNKIINMLKNPREEYPLVKFEGKWYKYGWNGSAVTAKEYKRFFQIKPSQTYTWNATQSTWLKPRKSNSNNKSNNNSNNKSNNNSQNKSNNNSNKNSTSLLPPLLKSNFRMGERTNLSPAALPQHYINSNGRGCICQKPKTWIGRFNANIKHWMIKSSNLNALKHSKRENNAPKIGMPNEKVFQREDGMLCLCRNWGSGTKNNNAVQQLITALVGRPPPSSSRPPRIDNLFKSVRQKKRTNAHRKRLLG